MKLVILLPDQKSSGILFRYFLLVEISEEIPNYMQSRNRLLFQRLFLHFPIFTIIKSIYTFFVIDQVIILPLTIRACITSAGFTATGVILVASC